MDSVQAGGPIYLEETGARGEGLAEVARRVGTIAGNPVSPGATDAQVLDSLAAGLTQVVAAAGYTVISAVRVATTANITLSGLQTIDGVALAAGDRVLVKDQAAAAANGIYVAATGAWARAADFDSAAEIVTGAYIPVQSGAQAGAFVLITQGAVTVGTTALVFRVFDFRSASKITTAQGVNLQSVLDTIFAVPEGYGAVGYASSSAALSGPDCTAQLQAMATDAAARGIAINGNGRWYKASTISWPSGSYAQNLKIVVPNATTDNAPFFVDGQSAAKSNITFIDCEVDGNRVGQTSLSSSGGDGQRAGFKLFGRTANIRMIRCKAWNCATDGIFIWTGSVVPANADDLLHADILLGNCDAQWNGRHGISFSSHQRTQIIGGRFKNNGKDAPGWTPSGTLSDGGYGRRHAGARFGRGVTHEGYFLGEHFENWTINNCDVTDNWTGTLLYAVMFATVRSHKNLRISGSTFDDPNGGGGDGCLVLYGVLDDGAGNRTPYTGTDAFDGVSIDNCVFRRNYVSLRSLKNWSISGRAEMDPAVSTYKLNLGYHGPADRVDISGNGTVTGYVLPFSLTYDYGTWTSGSATVTPLFPIIAGQHRVRITTTATMPGNATNNFQTVTLSTGWVFENYPIPSGVNNSSGSPLARGVAYINGNIGARSAYMVLPADGTTAAATVTWEPTVKVSGT